jgi:hypothetical protein
MRRLPQKRDRKRAAETASRQWDRRLDGWASKKYGENWEFYHAPARIEEEFDRCLEKHDDDDQDDYGYEDDLYYDYDDDWD